MKQSAVEMMSIVNAAVAGICLTCYTTTWAPKGVFLAPPLSLFIFHFMNNVMWVLSFILLVHCVTLTDLVVEFLGFIQCVILDNPLYVLLGLVCYFCCGFSYPHS